MVTLRSNFKYLAITAGLLVGGTFTAEAQSANLIRASGTPSIYWVDNFGIKHGLPDMQTKRQFFGDAAVTEISAMDILAIPKGQQLSYGAPPWTFDRQRDPYAVSEHIPVVDVRYERITRSRQGDLDGRQMLVRGNGSHETFYVDRYGVRHLVRGQDKREHFGNARAASLSSEELEGMPLGHSITTRTPPQYYDGVRRTSYYRDDN